MHNKPDAGLQTYQPKNKIRFVTATALFDGHDASINIMRRLIQARGGEVIHLGHNRSAMEIVQAAIQEDAQAIAVSSYQGGHVEFFKYMRSLLDERGATDVKLFGGGGGVITPEEIADLEKNGVTKIYSPEDGARSGLEGIIGHLVQSADFGFSGWDSRREHAETRLGRALTLLENGTKSADHLIAELAVSPQAKRFNKIPVIGITGTGGAGKSSLTDELVMRFLWDFPELRVALLCIDPSKKMTGGALLGDRIRINSASDPRVFLRSLATRGSGKEISTATADAVKLMQSQDFDFVIIETSGIGQGDAGILELADLSLYVMTAEYGAATQLEKIDMLDYADLIAINKYERRQAPDALRDVRTTLRRSRFKGERTDESAYPVYGTIANRFNDDGTNGLYKALVEKMNQKLGETRYTVAPGRTYAMESSHRDSLIPGDRTNYLADIARAVRTYHKKCDDLADLVKCAESMDTSASALAKSSPSTSATLLKEAASLWSKVPGDLKNRLDSWDDLRRRYNDDRFTYQVRGKDVTVPASFETLSHLKLPRVALPHYSSKADVVRYLLKENAPGAFPYTAGVYPFRRTEEDPKRQFAGEGGPARTNARFHFLSKNDTAKRLSTAFDSVTLYGSEPHRRPDIYGKVGESGVSIATLDDMKVLYSGFDLCAPTTSVSMTINGPAPVILAMYLNAAVDQRIDAYMKENGGKTPPPDVHQKIFTETLQVVRGTVQADILKEDQAQNTCIFSTEFALKLMGDIQEYFIEKKVRNYYSVSISGYHIAEAGANPITQLACTLSNGFTYVEYYLARGMKIDDFAPSLSFFFSNGIDAEYGVLGCVARRIWAIAMRDIYGASERSQMLKYHIQTSGRSLHAQEMDFNDIRTTLQALMALYDNCNSLHTNAYDEAITTPTEESVRRAMAIQMIINKEFGLNKCENINQGSHFLDMLTDRVEEAVLVEFERLSARGGVLGAMETQYQRSKIQEESLYYEHLKHSGELPIIGVNTYLNPKVADGSYERPKIELARASYEEKDAQLARLNAFKATHADTRDQALKALSNAVIGNKNIFAELMNTVRHASLGEISELLYRVGGRYRRSM